MRFLPESLVTWRHYEYVLTGKVLVNGQEKKKLNLVTKETPPCQMSGYLRSLLKDYSMHSFMAK